MRCCVYHIVYPLKILPPGTPNHSIISTAWISLLHYILLPWPHTFYLASLPQDRLRFVVNDDTWKKLINPGHQKRLTTTHPTPLP